MEKYLEQEFFYDKDFNKIDDVAIAGDCMQQLIAIIMKKQLEGQYNPYAVYMDDISFNICCDSQGYLARSAIKSNIVYTSRKFAKMNQSIIKDNLDAARLEITTALETYGYALLRTVDAYLPFSIYYNERFDISLFQEIGHILMIVYEDEENYYFIDQLTELNMKKYTHVDKRRDIGVCAKNVFARALGIYAKVITVDLNKEDIINSRKFCKQILAQSVENYYNSFTSRKSDDDELDVCGGRRAIFYFENAYYLGKLVLNKKVYNTSLKAYCDVDIGRELMNGATGLKNRRLVLKGFLENGGENLSNSELIKSVDRSIEAWDRIKNRVIKKVYKEDFVFGNGEKEYIEDVISSEERMFDLLKNYVRKNVFI